MKMTLLGSSAPETLPASDLRVREIAGDFKIGVWPAESPSTPCSPFFGMKIISVH